MTMPWVQALSSLIPLKEHIFLFCSGFMVAMTVTLAFTNGAFEPIKQWEPQVQSPSQVQAGANEIESNVVDKWENVDHLITQTHSILKRFPYLLEDRIGVTLRWP